MDLIKAHTYTKLTIKIQMKIYLFLIDQDKQVILQMLKNV